MGKCFHCQGTGESEDSKIRNFDYFKQPINWGILSQYMTNPKMYPTDSDGFFDRNSHFLKLEWKQFTNQKNEKLVPIPTGQHINLSKFADARPENYGLAIWGESEECSPWVMYDYKEDEIVYDLRQWPELDSSQRRAYLGSWIRQWDIKTSSAQTGGDGNDYVRKMRRDRYETLFG